jgi:gamma-glutamyltranspeptidase/glutathione hydrolase
MQNVLGHDIEVQQAVETPRFHSEEPRRLFMEPAFPESVVDAVRAQGYAVERSTYMSCVEAIFVDDEGGLHPGADPRWGSGFSAADS